jgi:DNA-binding IclR family transcriptional regulator
MLKSLARTGLVEQHPQTRRYRLGWSLRVLAASAGNDALLTASRPVLQALVAKTKEVALLSVQEGHRSLTVLREESRHSLQAGGWVGRVSALHNSASGRALMFGLTDDQVDALTSGDIHLASDGPQAPRDLSELLARLSRERDQGYAIASEELEVGLTSISAPIYGHPGQVIAVVNVSGPTARLLDQASSVGEMLIVASRAIQRSLNHPANLRSGAVANSETEYRVVT